MLAWISSLVEYIQLHRAFEFYGPLVLHPYLPHPCGQASAFSSYFLGLQLDSGILWLSGIFFSLNFPCAVALRLSHLTGLCFSGSDSQGDSPPSGLTWTSNGTLFHRFGSVFTGPQSIAKTLFLFWGALVRYHGEGNGTHPTPAVLPGKSHGRRSLAGSTGSQRVGQH